jgi:hypothetical protein
LNPCYRRESNTLTAKARLCSRSLPLRSLLANPYLLMHEQLSIFEMRSSARVKLHPEGNCESLVLRLTG